MSNIHAAPSLLPSSLSAVTIFLSSDAHSASSAPFVRLEQFHSASGDAATPAHAAYLNMVARQLMVKNRLLQEAGLQACAKEMSLI